VKEFLKWRETFIIQWSKMMAYRADFYLQVIAPAVVFFMTKYFLWQGLYTYQAELGKDDIMGMNLGEMLAYHGGVFFVTLLCQSFNGQNLAEEIRLGKISAYLIYPFSFWKFHLASFFSFFVFQFVISSLPLFVMKFILHIPFSMTPMQFAGGLFFCFFSALLWFWIQFFIGVLSFWLEETWILRVCVQMMASFFSGAIIPLSFFPEWWRSILMWTPFPSLTGLPVMVFLGKTALSVEMIFFTMLYILVFFGLSQLIWRRGIRLYTAAGM
jgi:ABC-2 type transport system permease protein